MKAAILHGPGDIRVEEAPVPQPGPGEIRLKTLAATTCGTDRKVALRGYHAKMLRPPCSFGHEVAGEVEAVGENVLTVRVGERVVVANSAPCGRCPFCLRGRESLCEDLLFWNGAFAERCLIPERIVAKNVIAVGAVPAELAAMTEPLACCVKGVADSGVERGERVLVIGAGPIGLMLVALSRLREALVTACARREQPFALARSFGATETVLFSDLVSAPREFDVIFDAGGAPETAALALKAAARGGRVNLFAGCTADAHTELELARIHYDEIEIRGSFHHTPFHFREAFKLISESRIPVERLITQRITLEGVASQLLTPPSGALKAAVRFATP